MEIKILIIFDCRTDIVSRIPDMPDDQDTYRKFYKLINDLPTVFFREKANPAYKISLNITNRF